MTWIHSFAPKPGFVFVNHGEDAACADFAKALQLEGYAAEAPYNASEYILGGGQVHCVAPGNREKIAPKEPSASTAPEGYKSRRAAAAYERLVNMGKRLMVVIEHNLDVIKTADYIIDMGPEGGDRGGTVIAEGTPEEVARCEESYTGMFLKKVLN